MYPAGGWGTAPSPTTLDGGFSLSLLTASGVGPLLRYYRPLSHLTEHEHCLGMPEMRWGGQLAELPGQRYATDNNRCSIIRISHFIRAGSVPHDRQRLFQVHVSTRFYF